MSSVTTHPAEHHAEYHPGGMLRWLTTTKPPAGSGADIPEFRATENAARKGRLQPKSVWQMHGAGAVGGSINYITKLASRDQQIIDGRVRYGSFDDAEVAFGINQALASNPADARHFMRLDFSRSQGNGYIDRNQRNTDSLAFSLLSDLAPNLTHTLALEYQEDREESPYWGSPILPGRSTMKIDKSRRFENYNVADGRYEQRVRWLRSILDYQLSGKLVTLVCLTHLVECRDQIGSEILALGRLLLRFSVDSLR